MKYISNTGRYDRAYEITKGGQKLLLTLYRRRLYMDTGNVAVTGITPVEDKDYKELEKNRAFIRDMKDETMGLKLVEESVAIGEPDKRASELEEENKKLKEELKKAKEAGKENPDAKEVDKIKDENAKLKAQLEALTKGKETQDKAQDETPAEDKNDKDEKDEF